MTATSTEPPTVDNKRRRNIRAAELRAPDHFPVCPKCDDYNTVGAATCSSCGYRLLDDGR